MGYSHPQPSTPRIQADSTLVKTTSSNRVALPAVRSFPTTDAPDLNGPATVFWQDGDVAFRAVHYISKWNSSDQKWETISPDLTEVAVRKSAGYQVDGITALGHRGMVWYVGTLAGQVTVKQPGSAWMVIRGGLPKRTVTAIALPPNNPSGTDAVMGYGGYGTATPRFPGHVYSTQDGGEHWSDITGNLPDATVASLHFVRSGAHVFLVAKVGDQWFQMNPDRSWVKRSTFAPPTVKNPARTGLSVNDGDGSTVWRKVFMKSLIRVF